MNTNSIRISLGLDTYNAEIKVWSSPNSPSHFAALIVENNDVFPKEKATVSLNKEEIDKLIAALLVTRENLV